MSNEKLSSIIVLSLQFVTSRINPTGPGLSPPAQQPHFFPLTHSVSLTNSPLE